MQRLTLKDTLMSIKKVVRQIEDRDEVVHFTTDPDGHYQLEARASSVFVRVTMNEQTDQEIDVDIDPSKLYRLTKDATGLADEWWFEQTGSSSSPVLEVCDRFELNGRPGTSKTPDVVNPDEADEIVIAGDELQDQLNRYLSFAGNEMRDYLNGVYFEDGQVTASDAYKLIRQASDSYKGLGKRYFVAEQPLTILSYILKKAKISDDAVLRFDRDERVLYAKLPPGKRDAQYEVAAAMPDADEPPFESIIPDKEAVRHRYTYPLSTFEQELSAMEAVQDSDYNIAHFEPDGTLHSHHPEYGDYRYRPDDVTIDHVDGEDEDFELLINADHLRTILSYTRDEDITLQIVDEDQPVRIEDRASKALYLLVPATDKQAAS